MRLTASSPNGTRIDSSLESKHIAILRSPSRSEGLAPYASEGRPHSYDLKSAILAQFLFHVSLTHILGK